MPRNDRIQFERVFDDDYDEMNLHLSQSIESKAELTKLMMVLRFIITQQSKSRIMDIV